MAEKVLTPQSGCKAGTALACWEVDGPRKMGRGDEGLQKDGVRRALESREGDGGPLPPPAF